MAYQPKSYRKFVATAATAAMVASAVAPVAASTDFTDVPASYKDAVDYLVSTGATQGVGGSKFGTDLHIKRGDAAQMIATALGLDLGSYADAGFTDVPAHRLDAVNALKAEGIINGKTTTKFGTDDLMTRAEMAKVIALAFDLKAGDTKAPFSDVSATFAEYVNALYANEVTSGVGGGKYGSDNQIKRGDFAKFVFKAAGGATPEVISVSAINSIQAEVKFNVEISEVDASNFTVDNGLTVVSAKVNADDKTKVTLTFNNKFVDKETYTVTTDNVVSEKGKTLEEAVETEFTYEVAGINTITLDQVSFNSSVTSENLLDYVTIKDEKGRNLTSEVLDNTTDYDVTVSTTDATIVDTDGDVVDSADGSAYVEIKVLDLNDSSKVLASTGAVKVTVAPFEFTTLDGVHLSDAATTVSDYKTAKKNDKVDTTLQLSETGEVLNVYVKDAAGSIVRLDATNATIKNLTPTVAVLSASGSDFVVNPISTGTARAEITAGGFKTTVSFSVVANSKITSGSLDTSSLTLTTAPSSPASSGSVTLELFDQYGDEIDADETKVAIRYSRSGVVTAAAGVANGNAIDLSVTPDANGSTTVYVDYKNANGAVIFTKTFTVVVKDFGTAAKYDLVVSSASADYLDADDDTSETGVNALDNDVTFELYQVDAAGNRLATVALDGINNKLVLDLNALTDAEEALLAHTTGALATDTLSFANATLAQQSLTSTGTVKVTAVVNGVSVDSLNVTYKNTDSVASSAEVTKTSAVIDIDRVDAVSEILFGIYGSSSYTVSPLLTVKDQSGNAMTYNVASSSAPNVDVDGLYNGLNVDATWTTTNLSNLTVDPVTGAIVFNSGKTSGSFTLIVSKVETAVGGSAVNEDLLSAPVAIQVTVVK
jgi:hypothetical protein